MLAPVLITPPEDVPVSLDVAKMHLRVDHDDDDVLISSLIKAAVDHLDGWTGVLGRCLLEQTWRQNFDTLARCMPLPLGPVIEIVSVDYFDANGSEQTMDPDDYLLRTDAGGRSVLELKSWPSSRSASVTYKAGFSVVPVAITTAILMLVAHWYANREAAAAGDLATVPMAVDALLAPYRRVGV